MAQCVYWIRHNDHMDNTCEGYVGVSKDIKRRLREHTNSTRIDNKVLRHALETYQNEITIDVLFEGSEDDCYELELKLRPNELIGWNVAAGGKKPPSQKGKTYEEIYGIEGAKLQRTKRSLAKRGSNNPRFGKAAWNRGLNKDSDARVKNYGIKQSITKRNKGD